MPSGPFRREEHPVKFICTVCWRAASSTPGKCPNDGAPFQPVEGDFTLIEELRRRAREKKNRPSERLFKANLLLSLGAAIVIHGVLLACGVYDIKAGGSGPWLSGGSLLFLYVFVTAALLVIPNAYLLPAIPVFKAPAEYQRFDPDAASMDQLADWLGMSVDGHER